MKAFSYTSILLASFTLGLLLMGCGEEAPSNSNPNLNSQSFNSDTIASIGVYPSMVAATPGTDVLFTGMVANTLSSACLISVDASEFDWSVTDANGNAVSVSLEVHPTDSSLMILKAPADAGTYKVQLQSKKSPEKKISSTVIVGDRAAQPIGPSIDPACASKSRTLF